MPSVFSFLDDPHEPLPGVRATLRIVAVLVVLATTLTVIGLTSCGAKKDAEIRRLELAIEQQGTADVANALHTHQGLVERENKVLEERAAAQAAELADEAMSLARAAAQHATSRIQVDSAPVVQQATAAMVPTDSAARVVVHRYGDTTAYLTPKFVTDALALVQRAADSSFAAQQAEHDARLKAEAVIAHDSLVVIPAFETEIAGLHHDIALRDTLLTKTKAPRCGKRCGFWLGVSATVSAASAVLAAVKFLGGHL